MWGNYCRLVWPFFCFLLAVNCCTKLASAQNLCSETRCGPNAPVIQPPFRLKDTQPQKCGLIGFDLSCNQSNQTFLELPLSVKLLVNTINYTSQKINVTDPDGCLPRLLSNLNISASPFHYLENLNANYTLFNCSSMNTDLLSYASSSIPCLSAPGYQVYALDSTLRIKDVTLSYCTKLYDISSSVPNYVFDQTDDLILSWDNSRYVYMTETEGSGISVISVKLLAPALSIVLIAVVVIVLYHVHRTRQKEKEYHTRIEKFLEDYRALKPTRYSHADVKRITNNFKTELGQGAYGTVYKGILSGEISVAVKLLKSSTGNGPEFINEVGTMGQIHHVNVVRLVGFCADGHTRALVYEYLPNGSLQKFISTTDFRNHCLSWKKLQEIALGIAKGIEYLHQGCDQRILHFDIKPHNILLDQHFTPKISDFGLAKLCSKDQSAVSMTAARGTIGYIAPEVFSRNFGNVSYKSDVYSFGMLLLEMVGGKQNDEVMENETGLGYFPEWIYNLLEQGDDLREHIEEEKYAKIAKKLAIVGLWCIQWHPVDRPSMQFVVHMLEGDGDNLSMPPNPFASADPIIMNMSMLGRQLHKD
ncbi:rust resistance kinase Lr10-like [Gastrolobium bilobum]|uniref:rust resistance kinase Lr10-like n=1 Tax=Gastrolobium bilobum TaxID=150636 RepID=UPI002AB1AF64|nr:rust resistance kinase Lr10-like [Gastrolobium bilobum]